MCRSVDLGWFDSDTAPRIERSTDFAVLTKRLDAKRAGRTYGKRFIYLSRPMAKPGRHEVARRNNPQRGAARGIRTPDPIITNDVLYRLSYCGF